MSSLTDSPLSITGSIVGIVALLISAVTISHAVSLWASAYRSAPAELRRISASVSNTVSERSFRLRGGRASGLASLDLGEGARTAGQWDAMLQEYFDAHLELEEEIEGMGKRGAEVGQWLSWERVMWVVRRGGLEESVRRVETLRARKMAVGLNALAADVETIKGILLRLEARIPEGPINLPQPRPPADKSPSVHGRHFDRDSLFEGSSPEHRASIDSGD
ncbi:hypothetical protein EJ06DRAFT_558902 [Trichodelitschia bisporula]|uniref:Uncharacterized protein n=1 Tax=Trichodelitschia bisporula TaxID=703511 RepID=A0A6G1HMN0_9PEZI|nr:hypothetical protein EJ06DRAFT_558902 [Trichodelitschia bisporula]